MNDATPHRRRLKISDLRTDGGTQMREKVSEPTVREYAALMKDGAEFPPLAVFFDGKDHWLADGFHRLEAALQNGRSSVECEVREGSRRDAVLFSVSANAHHGLPRKHGDKRRAVETLLRDEEWGRWSNAAVATRAGVSTLHVARIRRQLMQDGEIERPDVTTYVRGGEVCEKRSQYGRSCADDAPHYKRDWLRILVHFTPEQFMAWRADMIRRDAIDRHAAAEAVENVVLESAKAKAA